MPSLADRKMHSPDTCRWCKHCWSVKIETDAGDMIGHYCMLDVPKVDRDYVDNEVLDGFGYIPKLADLSERFCQIMQIEDYHDLWDTPRRVWCTACCNYYQEPDWEED